MFEPPRSAPPLQGVGRGEGPGFANNAMTIAMQHFDISDGKKDFAARLTPHPGPLPGERGVDRVSLRQGTHG